MQRRRGLRGECTRASANGAGQCGAAERDRATALDLGHHARDRGADRALGHLHLSPSDNVHAHRTPQTDGRRSARDA